MSVIKNPFQLIIHSKVNSLAGIEYVVVGADLWIAQKIKIDQNWKFEHLSPDTSVLPLGIDINESNGRVKSSH